MEEYWTAVCYFTGSAMFNRSLRARALSKGYTLNEHALCRITASQPSVSHPPCNVCDLSFHSSNLCVSGRCMPHVAVSGCVYSPSTVTLVLELHVIYIIAGRHEGRDIQQGQCPYPIHTLHVCVSLNCFTSHCHQTAFYGPKAPV